MPQGHWGWAADPSALMIPNTIPSKHPNTPQPGYGLGCATAAPPKKLKPFTGDSSSGVFFVLEFLGTASEQSLGNSPKP